MFPDTSINAKHRRSITQASHWLIATVLVCAALLTVAIGNTADVRSMPDERHHYAVIKHIADHFGQFPLDYAAIRTDAKSDPNHLVHPPFYHYLLAVCYKVINPDRHFTQAGKTFDRHGSHQSGQAVIPILRGFSRFFVFLGLLGVFFLLRDSMRRGFLSPISAIGAVMLLSFISVFLYIGGGLNNDVLGLAIWPWLLLATITYIFDKKPIAFWQAWLLLGALVLTKASFWILVLAFGLLLGFRAMMNLKQLGWRLSHPFRQQFSSGVFFVAAILIWSLAFIHLGTQWHRYGKIQPSYELVYQIPMTESKFLIAKNIEKIKPRSPVEIAKMCALRITRSLRGKYSHLERTPDPYVTLIFTLSGAAVFLILAGSFGFWRDRRIQPWFKGLIAVLLALPCLNFAILLQVNFNFYQRTQNIAAEGRYFVGHLHFAIFALFILFNHTWKTRKDHRFAPIIAFIGIAILSCIYIRPLRYFNQTHEIYYHAKMSRVIPDQLRKEGYQQLHLEPWQNQLNRYRHLKWYPRLGEYFPLFNGEDQLVFHLPSTYHDWDLLIWTEVAEKPAPNRVLNFHQISDDVTNHDQPPQFTLDLPRQMNLVKITFPASQKSSGSHWRFSPSPPYSALANYLPRFLKPQFGPIKVFAVFARPAKVTPGPDLLNSKKDSQETPNSKDTHLTP